MINRQLLLYTYYHCLHFLQARVATCSGLGPATYLPRVHTTIPAGLSKIPARAFWHVPPPRAQTRTSRLEFRY
jgi:hypothetical protein